MASWIVLCAMCCDFFRANGETIETRNADRAFRDGCAHCDRVISRGERFTFSNQTRLTRMQKRAYAPTPAAAPIVALVPSVSVAAQADATSEADEQAPDTIREGSPDLAPASEPEDTGTPAPTPEVTVGNFLRGCGDRPYPYVRRTSADDLAMWEPEKRTQYYTDGAGLVRSGETFAIVRPGVPFPLGFSTDHRKIVSHNRTRESLIKGPVSAQLITPEACYIAGEGTQVIQTFSVFGFADVLLDNGMTLRHKLEVTNDHTGAGALGASLVCYIGYLNSFGDMIEGYAIGAAAVARARHMANNPSRWLDDVQALTETAMLRNQEIIDLLNRACAHSLTEGDREWLKEEGFTPEETDSTLLHTFITYTQGNSKGVSWGVWSRRLTRDAFNVAVRFFDSLDKRRADELAKAQAEAEQAAQVAPEDTSEDMPASQAAE